MNMQLNLPVHFLSLTLSSHDFFHGSPRFAWFLSESEEDLTLQVGEMLPNIRSIKFMLYKIEFCGIAQTPEGRTIAEAMVRWGEGKRMTEACLYQTLSLPHRYERSVLFVLSC
jgi:hypothetical protein